MKKLLSTFILFALALVGMAQQPDCWDGSVAESYAGGNGTPENPFQIATPQQLALLAQQTNFGTGGNACYVLTNDICLNDNLNVNPHNWIPIGRLVDTVPYFFTGRFDGNKMPEPMKAFLTLWITKYSEYTHLLRDSGLSGF